MIEREIEELVRAVRPRYVRAARGEKTRILDESVAITGYHRKAAIRRPRTSRRRKGRAGRPTVYTPAVNAALIEVWEHTDQICSKRLELFLGEMVAVLEREGELRLPLEVRERLESTGRLSNCGLAGARGAGSPLRALKPIGTAPPLAGLLFNSLAPCLAGQPWTCPRPLQ